MMPTEVLLIDFIHYLLYDLLAYYVQIVILDFVVIPIQIDSCFCTAA